MEDESAPLPDELITEILVRLPVKSLFRLKLVSKSWFALIRSPYFVNQHTKHDHKETMLLSTHIGRYDVVLSLHDPDSSDFYSLSPFPVPFKDWNFNDPLDVVGPCNGLFFLSNKSKPMLCNPALREIKVLPPRPSFLCENVLVYNQGDGFGFDPLTGSYKVVGIYKFLGGVYGIAGSPPEVELYDSRIKCWRIIDATHEWLPYVNDSGIFFRGACHWEASHHEFSPPVSVICFDVSTEVFRHFEFPKWKGDYEKCYRLSVLRDRLTLVCSPLSTDFPSSGFIHVWVMEEYGVKESWAQIFKLDRLNISVVEVYFFWENEYILVEDYFNSPKFLCLRNGELCRTLHGIPYRWNAMIFKESLISLDDVICNNARDG